ncbi:hypothetical protein P5673_021976 [Acropora cervicornis]|uniref:Uncharacterized protein n=1 Tax=Acropora cervicornis TaxID=6130 RepID=A0AAD9Q760_ACRCE|nr:hypothetical protein P5673_021976 [Acropora cervicornis]
MTSQYSRDATKTSTVFVDHQFGATQSKNFIANSNPRKQACPGNKKKKNAINEKQKCAQYNVTSLALLAPECNIAKRADKLNCIFSSVQFCPIDNRSYSVELTANENKYCSYVGSSLGFLSCNFFPILNPQKQMANIGATPTTGAAIPLYRPRKP